MTIRLTLLALLCGLLLAPAAAVAQSAGDDQYADPFGDEEQQQAQSTPAPAAPAPAAPATTPAPSGGAAQAPTAAAPGAAPTLPRTGHGALVAALAGVALIASGLALRAHARRLV
jgi:LPXTG-motif cell wall-anchored protein